MTEEIAKMRTANSEQLNYCPLFSIIIPVYNCEKYVARTLDSLINQNYHLRNYEIIIVNDGSKDSSGKICDNYAEKFPFIHVTHTQNFGQSHARNVGLKQCTGDFIMWCDADDIVSPSLISVLTRAIELHNDVDIFVYNYCNELKSGNWPEYREFESVYVDNEEACLYIGGYREKWGGFLWNKAVRRKIAENIYMDEKMKIFLDMKWLLEVLASNKDAKILWLNCCLYCYIIYPGVGVTRNVKGLYTSKGCSWGVKDYERIMLIKNLSPRMKRNIASKLCAHAFSNFYQRPIKPTPGVIRKINLVFRKYICMFYRNSDISIKDKLKMFIKHIFFCLNIHK